MWLLVTMFVLAVSIVVMVLLHLQSRSVQPSRESKMIALDVEPASSYAQKTNHLAMPPVDMGPITGTETPFRVNMYQAYM